MEKVLGTFAPQLYALMRIVVGLLFASHGAQKLFGIFGGEQFPPLSLMGLAGAIGGLLIAGGFTAGLVAFIASGEMAAAYFMGHFPKSFWPIVNEGELAVFFCFVFLYMASQGSGIWSVDRARGGRRRRRW